MKTSNTVVVTTAHRGVFFGTVKEDHGKEKVILKDARNCISWSKSVKGFLGLASTGPDNQCRIGPAVKQLILYDITSVTECTASAAKAWKEAPWTS